MRYAFTLLVLVCLATAAEPFRLVIDTRLVDSLGRGSAANQFTLPLFPSESYDCTVDWGDGSPVQSITTAASPTHTFPAPGVYTLAITERSIGGFPRIYFNHGGDSQKATALAAWGTGTWRSMAFAFAGCSNMGITATDESTAQTGGIADFTGAWTSCALESFPAIDTSGGTVFTAAWWFCDNMRSFARINTSRATTFDSAWGYCTTLSTFPPLDTSRSTSFRCAWLACRGLTSFPAIDTSQGVDFSGTWSGCFALASFPRLDLGRMSTVTVR